MFNVIDIVIYLAIAAIINRIIINNNNVVFDNNVYDKHYYNDLSNDLSYMEIMNTNHTMDDNLCKVQNIYGYNNQSIKIIIPENIVVVI